MNGDGCTRVEGHRIVVVEDGASPTTTFVHRRRHGQEIFFLGSNDALLCGVLGGEKSRAGRAGDPHNTHFLVRNAKRYKATLTT